jgi:hypothetical protein
MFDKLQQTIFSMLTENTGRSFLDSGGAYGRHWERNQSRTIESFANEERVSWHGDYWLISVFHYLCEKLGWCDLCEEFSNECLPAEDWDSDMAYGLSSKGQEWLESHGFRVSDEFSTFNTYNWQSSFSQELQGTFLKHEDGGRYLLLQIHGGCDIRGGYTDARLFECDPYEFFGESVFGSVIRPNGEVIEVDSSYDGHSLRNSDDHSEVEITEDDQVHLMFG